MAIRLLKPGASMLRKGVRGSMYASVAKTTALGALLATLLTGCPQQYPDPLDDAADPECGTAAYSRIVTAEALDLKDACQPTPIDKCAESRKGPVKAKWAPVWDKWERCGEE